ncbi:MAG: hypothetical protein IKS55_15590 [Oscillospiraceae bacterium]|nr:hypothetical protein [Oscillospiraceae bacterium]
MEDSLQVSLEPGEQILWQGGTEAFETLDNTHKKSFAVKAIIGSLVAILISAVYVFAVINTAPINYFVFLVVFILCGIPAFNFLGDAHKLRKTVYLATDRRLIVLRDSVHDMKYACIHEAAFRMDRDGHVSLLCGDEAMKLKPEKWREAAVVGQRVTEGPDCHRFVFYAPSDPEALKDILNAHLSFSL